MEFHKSRHARFCTVALGFVALTMSAYSGDTKNAPWSSKSGTKVDSVRTALVDGTLTLPYTQ
jgi:hypothetical protein